jgi:sialate O-acetylesterase
LQSNPEYKRAFVDPYLEKPATSGTNKNIRPLPAQLYNGMIAPLIPYSIKGAIWYQGESNAGRAKQYRTLFADMIRNWRQDWDQGDFPFLAVQLAPYDKVKKRDLAAITAKPDESDWAELREAQLLATKVLPNVGMAVITDVGEKDDIHPRKKEPVGGRLALAARGIAYREKIEFSGPIYKSMKIKRQKAILSFDHGDGLEARDGELKGFAICGPDKKFVWASAVIEGDKVVVSSPEVSHPVAVRYGWSDYPVVNLWNKAGLPASPFRTDGFPMITAAAK